MVGTEKPVFGSMGQGLGSGEVGRIREYSDTLLIFLLKAAQPEKYRETTRTENLNIDLSQLSEEQLARIAAGEDPLKVVGS